MSRKDWSSQVEEALTVLPEDSSIWSPLSNSQAKSSSDSEGNLVIDESEAASEIDINSLKRSRDADDASFVTVSRCRLCKKRPKEPRDAMSLELEKSLTSDECLAALNLMKPDK